MKIYIPSYKRSERQKTLEFLETIEYPPKDINICVQSEEDYNKYQSYSGRCNVLYKSATSIAQNRNNILSYINKGDKALVLDDNIDSLYIYQDNEFKQLKTAESLLKMVDEAFDYCEKHNAKVFTLEQSNNLYFKAQKTKDKPYELNKKGSCFFGIIKSDIMFDNNLPTKEDYDFLLAHISKGQNTVLVNKLAFQKQYNSKGGCYEVHNKENEKKTAQYIVKKYPHYAEIYDETEIRFIPKLKYGYQSPRWTGEIADCTLPLTFDTYSNCSFGCVYCFSQYQRGVGEGSEDYYAKKVKAVNPEKIKKIFSGEDKDSQFYQYIKTKRPIQWGGLSDQFDGFEKQYGVTYEILKYLKEINYPICFSTKSAWVFKDPKYQELFKGADNWNMKFSIITLDERDASKIEVGVATPQERLEAMRIYNTLSKGGTTLRLRPFIVGVSDKTYLDLIKQAHDAGATAVTTEFFCLEMRSIKQAKEHYDVISECCGFDIVDFYRKYSNGSGYLRLNRKVKEKYVRNMQELCHKLGMRFYVSDAHFKECCDNCSCCALPPEWDYSRGNFSGALQIAKRCGEVRWSDIEGDMYYLDFPAVKAVGCQVARSSQEVFAKFNGMTMKDFLRYLWNNPKRGQSPYKLFERVLKPDGLDENGDIIYKYNEDVTFEKCRHQKRDEIVETRV